MSREGSAGAFAQSFPWQIAIKWFDREGLYRLNEDLMAHVKFDTDGTHDHYPGFRVRIVSVEGGELISKFFYFDDYLHERQDTRTDYGKGGGTVFQVIGSIAWDWYIARPRYVAPFVKAVTDFILEWRP